MVKLKDWVVGYIDLYGNDIYGLGLVIDMIKDRGRIHFLL
jgi:hypothetical protein